LKHTVKDDSRKQENAAKDAEANAIQGVIDMPNLDDRPSVFTDLEDIKVTDDEDGVAEVRFTDTVGFEKPSDQSFVRCHPNPDRVIKD